MSRLSFASRDLWHETHDSSVFTWDSLRVLYVLTQWQQEKIQSGLTLVDMIRTYAAWKIYTWFFFFFFPHRTFFTQFYRRWNRWFFWNHTFILPWFFFFLNIFIIYFSPRFDYFRIRFFSRFIYIYSWVFSPPPHDSFIFTFDFFLFSFFTICLFSHWTFFCPTYDFSHIVHMDFTWTSPVLITGFRHCNRFFYLSKTAMQRIKENNEMSYRISKKSEYPLCTCLYFTKCIKTLLYS